MASFFVSLFFNFFFLKENGFFFNSVEEFECFKTKDFSHECEAKDVSSIVIQIWVPFMQRVYAI